MRGFKEVHRVLAEVVRREDQWDAALPEERRTEDAAQSGLERLRAVLGGEGVPQVPPPQRVGENSPLILDVEVEVSLGLRLAPSPRAMMPPVDVPTTRSKWSSTGSPMSASRPARSAAAKTPRTPPPSIASTWNRVCGLSAIAGAGSERWAVACIGTTVPRLAHTKLRVCRRHGPRQMRHAVGSPRLDVRERR